MSNHQPKSRLSLERTFSAPLAEVWALWTTPEGIESWWGPEGFQVTVRAMDLRPGGVLRYAMTATAPPQVAFMREHGMPLTTESVVTYAQVEPQRRLAYVHLVDFVPGHPSYDVTTEVVLEPTPTGVRMVLSFDPMHDETWTGRAVAGWESELDKLARRIGA